MYDSLPRVKNTLNGYPTAGESALLPSWDQWGLYLLRIELKLMRADNRKTKVAGRVMDGCSRSIPKKAFDDGRLKDSMRSPHFQS